MISALIELIVTGPQSSGPFKYNPGLVCRPTLDMVLGQCPGQCALQIWSLGCVPFKYEPGAVCTSNMNLGQCALQIWSRSSVRFKYSPGAVCPSNMVIDRSTCLMMISHLIKRKLR